MYYVIVAIIGFVIGVIFTTLWARRSSVGTIMFYQIDPDEAPIMTAELKESVDMFRKRKTAIFKVSHN